MLGGRSPEPLRVMTCYGNTGGHAPQLTICYSEVNEDSNIRSMVYRTSIRVVVETHMVPGSDFRMAFVDLIGPQVREV